MSQDYLQTLNELDNYLQTTPLTEQDGKYIAQTLGMLSRISGYSNEETNNYLQTFSYHTENIFSDFSEDPIVFAYITSILKSQLNNLDSQIEQGSIENPQLISIINSLKLLLEFNVRDIVLSQSDIPEWGTLFRSHYNAFNTSSNDGGLMGYDYDPENINDIYDAGMTSLLAPEELDTFNQPIPWIDNNENDNSQENKVDIKQPEVKLEAETPEEYDLDESGLIRQTCYDQFVELEDIPIEKHISNDSKDNLLLFEKPEGKKPIKVDCYSRSALRTILQDPNFTFYECKTYSLAPSSVIRDTVYVLISATMLGNILVKRSELIGSISDANNYTLILEKVRDVSRLASIDVIDRQGSHISAKHCQDGSGAPLYKIWKCGGDKCLKSVFESQSQSLF